MFNIDNFTKMGRKAHQLTEEEKEAFEDVIRLKDDVVNKILRFEQAMLHSKNVRDYATAFYETMEAFDLPKYLMAHRDELDLKGTMRKQKKLTNYGMD